MLLTLIDERLSLWTIYYREVNSHPWDLPLLNITIGEHKRGDLVKIFQETGMIFIERDNIEPSVKVMTFDQWLFSKGHYHLVINFKDALDCKYPEPYPRLNGYDYYKFKQPVRSGILERCVGTNDYTPFLTHNTPRYFGGIDPYDYE